MENPRHIELAVTKVKDNIVTFKIVKQTHHNCDFLNGGKEFHATNGYKLVSQVKPEWNSIEKTLYCKGCDSGKDNVEVSCSVEEFAKISEAISEYNSTNGKGYSKPWPQPGDQYFTIGTNGIIETNTFNDNETDHNYQQFGNFFQTYGKAFTAAQEVTKLLKSFK